MNDNQLKILFGKRVKSIRISHKFTQAQLAEKIGCSVEYISRIERGLASPSFDSISKLADALGVTAKTLFDFTDKSS
jgi:transcriptional regulator with XRE-family HTH domain